MSPSDTPDYTSCIGASSEPLILEGIPVGGLIILPNNIPITKPKENQHPQTLPYQERIQD